MSGQGDVSGAAVPVLPRGVKLRHDEARGQWVLLGPERVLKLDDISAEILKRCDGEANVENIIGGLAEDFGADAETVGADVKSFLEDIHTRGFLVLK